MHVGWTVEPDQFCWGAKALDCIDSNPRNSRFGHLLMSPNHIPCQNLMFLLFYLYFSLS